MRICTHEIMWKGEKIREFGPLVTAEFAAQFPSMLTEKWVSFFKFHDKSRDEGRKIQIDML